MSNVLQFKKDYNTYLKLALERAEKGDLAGALGFLFSAKAISNDYQILAKIADVYAEMGVLELSNKYWFYYLDKAPKEKQSVAIEELAINFFYMDEYIFSSYYFHKKLELDGYITKEGLDPEIIEFFSGEEMRKNAYHIAYPFDRADFSYDIRRGKRSLSVGDADSAVKIFSAIPSECLDEDGAGDFAIALLMLERVDQAIVVARNSLEKHGDNVTAYCNLSTAYDMKEDYGKSEYYYKKAKECAKGDKNEEYKIATCAIERLDHMVVKDCLEKILKDRPHDLGMRFFYGVALLNCGEVESAHEQFSKAYRLNPEEPVYKFFVNHSARLKDGAIEQSYTPLRYLKTLPEKVEEDWKKTIRELINNPSKIPSAIKKDHVKEKLEWGVASIDRELARECVYVLATAFNPYAKSLMLQMLKNSEIESSTKRVIVFALVVGGYKEKFSVADANMFFKIKPAKLNCEKQPNGSLYLSAYALCLSRIAFFGEEKLEKLAKVTDKVYSKLKDKITHEEVSNEELASLILLESKYQRFASEMSVLSIFDVSREKLKILKKIYKGENND